MLTSRKNRTENRLQEKTARMIYDGKYITDQMPFMLFGLKWYSKVTVS